METEKALQALRQLFENVTRGQALAPVRIEAAKPRPKETKKVETQKAKAAPKPEAKTEAPKDVELVRKAIVQVGQEAGRPLTASEKMTVFVSERFRTTVGIENQRLLGGVSRLGREVNWNDPTPEEWEKARGLLGGMPKMSSLSEQDQMVLREVRQAAFEHYYRNHGAIQAPGLSIEKVQEDPALKGASVERVQRDEQQIYHGVKSEHAENTPAWAEDVEKQIIDEAKLPPEVTITVTTEEANKVIQDKIKVSKDFDWLVKDGEGIEDPQIAQIVHDIVEGGPNPSKELLLVKGSQLKHGRGLGEGAQESPERQKFRQRLLKKVQESYGFSEDPRKPGSGATSEQKQLFEAITHEVSGFESGTPARAGGRGRARGPDSHEFSGDLMRALGRGKEADALRARLDDFNRKMRFGKKEDKGREIYYFLEGDRNHDGFRFESAVMEAEETNPEFESHIKDLREKALNWFEEYNFSRGIERGWSSLYLDVRYLKKAWISPDSLLRSLQDEANMYALGMPIPHSPLNRFLRGTLYAGGVSKAAEHIRQQVEQYIQSEEYVDHRIKYLKNEKNWDDITRLSHQDIRAVGVENHKWYQEITDRSKYGYFKAELSKNVNMRESLAMLNTGWQSGTDPGELKKAFSNFGEESIIGTLKNRPINIPMWNMYQRIAREELKWKNGKMHAPDAHTHEKIFIRLVNEAKMHQGRLDDIWNHWEGSGGAGLTDSDIQNSAREVIMLATITGRRATLIQMALNPREAGGQNGSTVDFAGESPDGQLMAALGPLRYLIVRWGLDDPVVVDSIRHSAYIEVERYDIAKTWDDRLMGVTQGSEEFKRIAEWAFYIQEPNNPDAVKKALSWLRWNPDGSPRAGKDFATTLDAPTRPGDRQLTVKELKEWIMVRQGIELFDARSTGAYNFWEWGVNLDLIIPALKARFTGARPESIALLERTKRSVDGLLNKAAYSHKDLHTAQREMINRDPHHGPEGVMIQVGRFDPLSTMEALYTKGHQGAYNTFHRLLSDMNLVHDATGGTESIVDGRLDLLVKRVRLPMEYIDEKMAGMRRGRVDYSQPSAEELTVVREVCTDLGIDPDKYISLMKKLSDFALDEGILKDVVNPVYVTHFGVVNYMDVRLAEIDNDWAPEQWSRKGSQDPDAAGSLLFRWAGDTSNSKKAVGDHLLPFFRGGNEEAVLRELDGFLYGAEFSGGRDTMVLGAQSLGGGILRSAIMDKKWDYFGTDPETTMYFTSNRTRAGGLGQMSLRRDKADHFWHQVERIANANFHKVTPGMAHAIDKVTGMGINIGPLHIPTIRIYNGVGYITQGTVLLALAAYENARKSLNESSGGGGGGGGDHH